MFMLLGHVHCIALFSAFRFVHILLLYVGRYLRYPGNHWHPSNNVDGLVQEFIIVGVQDHRCVSSAWRWKLCFIVFWEQCLYSQRSHNMLGGGRGQATLHNNKPFTYFHLRYSSMLMCKLISFNVECCECVRTILNGCQEECGCHHDLSRNPGYFLEPLTFNGTPGNIQGYLTLKLVAIFSSLLNGPGVWERRCPTWVRWPKCWWHSWLKQNRLMWYFIVVSIHQIHLLYQVILETWNRCLNGLFLLSYDWANSTYGIVVCSAAGHGQ